jgi:hypothetical protein
VPYGSIWKLDDKDKLRLLTSEARTAKLEKVVEWVAAGGAVPFHGQSVQHITVAAQEVHQM